MVQGTIAVLVVLLLLMLSAMLGHDGAVGRVVGPVAQVVLPLVMAVLYLGIPLFLVIAAWRWAAAMLHEVRAIRKDLNDVAAALEREQQRR